MARLARRQLKVEECWQLQSDDGVREAWTVVRIKDGDNEKFQTSNCLELHLTQ